MKTQTQVIERIEKLFEYGSKLYLYADKEDISEYITSLLIRVTELSWVLLNDYEFPKESEEK